MDFYIKKHGEKDLKMPRVQKINQQIAETVLV